MELSNLFCVRPRIPRQRKMGANFPAEGNSSVCTARRMGPFAGESVQEAAKHHTVFRLTGPTRIPRFAGVPVPAASFRVSTHWG